MGAERASNRERRCRGVKKEIGGETVEIEGRQQSSKNMSKKFKIGPKTAFLTWPLSSPAVKYCGVDLLINGLIRRGPQTDFYLFTAILSLTLSSYL